MYISIYPLWLYPTISANYLCIAAMLIYRYGLAFGLIILPDVVVWEGWISGANWYLVWHLIKLFALTAITCIRGWPVTLTCVAVMELVHLLVALTWWSHLTLQNKKPGPEEEEGQPADEPNTDHATIENIKTNTVPMVF